jgi:hypothetical protein
MKTANERIDDLALAGEIVNEAIETETESPMAMAKRAVAQCDGDWDKSVALLMQWVHDDIRHCCITIPPQALIWELVPIAARYLVRMAAHETRSSIVLAASNRGKTDGPPSKAGLLYIAHNRWYDFPLPDSQIKLGDAHKKDLDDAFAFYQKMAQSNQIRAEFIDRVRKHLKGNHPVRDQLSEQQIAELAIL